MTFLYFIPGGGDRVSRAELVKLGLGYALAPAGEPNGRKSKGPEDGVGYLMDPAGGDDVPAFNAEQQTWRKGPEGKYWVGFWKDRKPSEATLRRPTALAGELVKLRDGGEWIIPIVHSTDGNKTTPNELQLDEDGKTWVGKTCSEYAELEAAGEKAFNFLFTRQPAAGETATDGTPQPVKIYVNYSDIMAVVLTALGTNYRVSAVEVDLLKLFGEREYGAVLRAMIDFKSYLKMADAKEKKASASDSSPSAAG